MPAPPDHIGRARAPLRVDFAGVGTDVPLLAAHFLEKHARAFRRLEYKIEELSTPMDHYGACLAAVVFMI